MQVKNAKEWQALEKRQGEIRAVKARLRINYAEVARTLEPPVTKEMVGAVAALKFTSRRVVEALVARGVPAKLFLPEYPGLDACATKAPSPPGRTHGFAPTGEGEKRVRAA